MLQNTQYQINKSLGILHSGVETIVIKFNSVKMTFSCNCVLRLRTPRSGEKTLGRNCLLTIANSTRDYVNVLLIVIGVQRDDPQYKYYREREKLLK